MRSGSVPPGIPESHGIIVEGMGTLALLNCSKIKLLRYEFKLGTALVLIIRQNTIIPNKEE